MSVKNFVQCGLVTPVAANTTELVLMAPTASYQYPPLDGGTLVIADSVARPSFYEIISYTHRIENVLYGVVRAKEGTTARTWSGVTWIYQALTAQDYVDALALKAALDSPALTGTPTAPTAALGVNTNQIATMAAVKAAIDNLVGGAPGALDALNEFAAALGNDPNFATTMTNALAGKEPSIAAGTSAQMWLGNKTWASVLSQVQGTLLTGLGAGANTPIVNTDTLIGALAKLQNQLNNKADFTDSRLSDAREWTAAEVTQAEAEAGTLTTVRKWSPLRVWQAVLASSLTGINLTLGTAVTATDTVLIAIGKLQKQITDAATNLAGNVRATVLTGYTVGTNTAVVATDSVLAAFQKLQGQMNTRAPLDSPALTGVPTAVTAAVGTNTTQVATTAFVNAEIAADAPTKTGGGASGTWPVAISGNAATATALQTARTINGVSFNGTANITVADATKEPSIAAGTAQQFWRGDKAWGTIAASDVPSLDASKLATGVIADGRLPERLRAAAANITDWNNATGNGWYMGSGAANAPTADATWYKGLVEVHNASWVTQTVFAFSSNGAADTKTWRRECDGGTWGTWYRLRLSEAEQSALYNNASNLSSGIVPDARLSGTYTGVNITGNAATATKLATSRTINGVAFDGTADIAVADSTKMPLAGGTFTGVVQTRDAGINSAYVGGSNAFHVMGGPSSGAVFTLHRAGTYAINIGLDTDNVFRIGGWSDGETHRMHLDSSGNFTARGKVTAYSDIRLKTDIQVIPDALAKVCALRGVTYERLDSGERQTGVIAQEVEAVLPEAVQDTGDYLSVAYGNLVGLLIESIKELNGKVDSLQKELDELRRAT